MKRIEISNEKAPNFIGCWFLEEKNISKGIIDFFENNQSLQKKALQLKELKKIEKNLQILQSAQISCLIQNIKFFRNISLNSKSVLWTTESNGLL